VYTSLEIGVLLHTRHLIRDAERPASFDELWEGTARAEEMGFDHVMYGSVTASQFSTRPAESALRPWPHWR